MTRTCSHITVLLLAFATASCHQTLDADRPGGAAADTDWLWKELTPGSAITPGIDSTHHVIFTVSGNRELLALRAHTGEVLWRTKYGDGFPFGENIAVAGDVVVVGDTDVLGFRTSTGQLIWHLSRPDGFDGTRTIATDGETFFVGGHDGLVRRLAAHNANPLWSLRLVSADTVLSAFGPTLVGSTLFVCGVNYRGVPRTGSLFALEAATGALIWRYDYTPTLPGQSSKCFSQVARSGDLVISAQDDGRIFAHDYATGVVRWVAPRIHSPPGDPSGPGTGAYDDRRYVAADADRVVVTSDGATVVCYAARTGAELWRTRASGTPIDPPALAPGLAIISHSGFVVAYDLISGTALWTRPNLDLPSEDFTRFHGQPVIAGDTLYLTGFTGTRARLLRR
ncbi:MAG: PQQ-binding-like beta-propeller repeat protein [Gemmatimonadaceae bacterium]|nr:PQQ-binding-like beta-propeller repeat protein [Gemmatimonadaceae bacterium]